MPGLDFSFSGLKTALLYAVRDLGPEEAERAAGRSRRELPAGDRPRARRAGRGGRGAGRRGRIAVVGGVAANSELRAALPDAALAPLALCTDNAAMIASAARYADAIQYPGYLALDASAWAAEPRLAVPLALVAASPSPRSCSAPGRRLEAAPLGVAPPPGAGSSASRARPPRSASGCSSSCGALARRTRRARGRARDRTEERPGRPRRYATQKQLISELGSHGLQVAIEYSYARVLNGFSAALDARAVALLERSPEVAGVYPVRVAYPATVSSKSVSLAAGSAVRPERRAAGLRRARRDDRAARHGRRPRAAVPARPRPAGDRRVGGDARRARRRAPTTRRSSSGTGRRWPGSSSAPAGPRAARGRDGRDRPPDPRRRLAARLPQRLAVYARSDQVIAGLERAVDPNDDGDAHDAARIALLPLAEPYAAFADSPEARAVDGALDLDTLVVAAAGNDGPAGPGYGSISGPGGAAGALTVGAADLRTRTVEARVVLRTGLRVALRPARAARGRGAAARAASGRTRRAAGRGRRDAREHVRRPRLQPRRRPRRAARGGEEPGGHRRACGAGRRRRRRALRDAGSRPARSASTRGSTCRSSASRRRPRGPLVAAVRGGAQPAASIGAPDEVGNGSTGRVASFSSRGLAFDGRLKPDLLAPGVAVLTSEPGENDDGSASFGSVSGSSVAAAVVAGAAAVLAQARPSLGAAQLSSLLIGTARRIPGEDATAQGTGLVDLGGAASAELLVDPPTLALGRADRAGRTFRRTIVLHSLSPRTIRVFVGPRLEGASAGSISVTPSPQRVVVRPFTTARVTLTTRVLAVPATRAPAIGVLDLTASGGGTTRTPLTLTFGPRPESLIRDAVLSVPSFRPSDATPAVLSVSVGGVTRDGAPRVEPVQRLDLRLYTAYGRPLGLLARLRDLLPGRYVFGLTGRGPGGALLHPGAYRIRLVGIPTDGGPPSLARVGFRIK